MIRVTDALAVTSAARPRRSTTCGRVMRWRYEELVETWNEVLDATTCVQ